MERYEERDLPLPSEPMLLNMGPSHPAMHGTTRCLVQLDGEIVRKADVQVGFLHRGFEKECEAGTWNQVFPYTDRLNYASPILNNIGYALAVEKLLDVEAPPRAQALRVILSELARIQDHLVCIAAFSMELGAFTPFLYLVKTRDWIYNILEKLTGARVTHSWMRIGGLKQDIPDDFEAMVRAVLPKVEVTIRDVEGLLLRNRILMDRTVGVGVMTKESALSLGWTGPCLRSTGVPYDVRKADPYCGYDLYDFDVPVGTSGDNYDRFVVRLEEMRQSSRIIVQALDKLPGGAFRLDIPDVTLPDKHEVYTTIEGTIRHFMIIMNGEKIPPGEVYACIEAVNGELGFYLVSSGEKGPYKCRVRPPCFANVSGLSEMVTGGFLADIIPSFGSINMIGGECDR
jgi:NADH-quinone oxidoreductase subunit D